jgi:hypothetical protein
VDIAYCALLFDKPSAGVRASDHFDIVADVVVPNYEETIFGKKQQANSWCKTLKISLAKVSCKDKNRN